MANLQQLKQACKPSLFDLEKRKVELSKILLTMKLTTVFLFITSLHAVANNTNAQVTFSAKDVAVERVFDVIKRQTGYQFFYTAETLQRAKHISLDVKEAGVNEVMNICVKDQEFGYSIEGKTIYIVKRKNEMVDRSTINDGDSTVRMMVSGKVQLQDSSVYLEGVSVMNRNTKKGVTTNAKGEFEISAKVGDILEFSFVGLKPQRMTIHNIGLPYYIQMAKDIKEQEAVTVVSSGYQQISEERLTGSFSTVDNKLINRSVTTNILDRIENLTPGVLFNHGDATNTGDNILIRGRSTLFANAQPLIVLDNFPYDGSLNNINPNDIESITVLKDASAASIWGARAGNGVIVITTKKGKTNKTQIEINSNITLIQEPDLSNIRSISSQDEIELEKYLYSQGYYNSAFIPGAFLSTPPVAELLHKAAIGAISQTDANSQIEAMKGNNLQNDESRYFYRNSINQQHSVNVSGNTPNINYYLSAGWDHNLNSLVGSQYDRISLRSQNIFRITNDFQIDLGVNYVQNISKNEGNPGATSYYPYAKLADGNNSPLPINYGYNNSFIQTAQNSGLMNWQYKPLGDIQNVNINGKIKDYILNAGIRYALLNNLNFEIRYQYEDQIANGSSYYNDSSYFVRNLINRFTQVNGGTLSYPIPLGGVFDQNNSETVSHQGRAQINFNQTIRSKHQIAGILGYEIKSLITSSNSNRLYGYEPEVSKLNPNIDYITSYTLYSGDLGSLPIPNPIGISKTTDHFISYYGNAVYTYGNRYIISGSIRKDEANLFGVSTNQKGSPFWSIGGGWLLNNEKFFHASWLSLLKFRISYGYNGNISRLASAYTTAFYYTAATTPANVAEIQTPPNSHLSWEKDGITNVGLDFEVKNKIFSGAFDFFVKKAQNLMGQAPIDPTLGLIYGLSTQSFFYGNVAGMKGKGADFQLNSHNLTGKFAWNSTFLLSFSSTEVTKYLMPVSSSGNIYLPISKGSINPVVGRPLFAVYSFKWAGLDPATGNPMGYINGKSSSNWASIYSQTPLDSMKYAGPSSPTWFGALRNTFTYKGLTLSFNISYKLGYYFREPSVNYYNLFKSSNSPNDYSKRWQQPGDEKNTNVPSLPSNVNNFDPNRDIFYGNSEVLVKKADNIRLEDISFSYDFNKNSLRLLPFNHIRVYLYAANLGTIWVANKDGIDPYYNHIAKLGKSIALGMNINF